MTHTMDRPRYQINIASLSLDTLRSFITIHCETLPSRGNLKLFVSHDLQSISSFVGQVSCKYSSRSPLTQRFLLLYFSCGSRSSASAYKWSSHQATTIPSSP